MCPIDFSQLCSNDFSDYKKILFSSKQSFGTIKSNGKFRPKINYNNLLLLKIIYSIAIIYNNRDKNYYQTTNKQFSVYCDCELNYMMVCLLKQHDRIILLLRCHSLQQYNTSPEVCNGASCDTLQIHLVVLKKLYKSA